MTTDIQPAGISWQEVDALLELASTAPMNSPTRLWLQGISVRLAQAEQAAKEAENQAAIEAQIDQEFGEEI